MKRFFSAAKKDSTLELIIYDQIGAGWFSEGVTAKDVKAKLDAAGDVRKIIMRLNSPGGDVFEGSAIYSLLAQHPAEVECFVDGLAASAAFTIAMAADTIHISEAALMMMHNAWGLAMGDASEMRKTADVLDKIGASMRGIYAKRSGKSEDEIQTLMDAETWLTAAEAVDAGFADDVIKSDPEESKAARALAASYDMKAFKKVPDALKVEPEPEPETVEVAAAGSTHRQRARIREIA